jgi:hypothetical protein
MAVALLGQPRVTKDVDVLVLAPAKAWPVLFQGAKRHGFAHRERDPAILARDYRMLLLRHVATGTDIDIVLGLMPFEEQIIARATLRSVKGVRLPLPTPEDLIVLKAIGNRPQDLVDIVGVLDAHPSLDLEAVRRQIQQFAEEMEGPAVYEDFATVLTRWRASQSKRKRRRE